MLSFPQTSQPLSPSQQQAWQALIEKRFFKLISGGSLTDMERVLHIAQAFAQAGSHCIDIAPEPELLYGLTELFKQQPGHQPMVMVSIPLDPDPHFRKIDLNESACIHCGICVPICPTEAFTLAPMHLDITQRLCYGCGRCVPACPTDALSLHPFQVERHIEAALENPLTEAVEIHSHYLDSTMLANFLEKWQPLLNNKLISLCFRTMDKTPSQIIEFCTVAMAQSVLPVFLQIDGIPMSGTEAPDASLPALESALLAHEVLSNAMPTVPPITISGGINLQTAQLLQQPPFQAIAGVGMGTIARKAIWHLSPPTAYEKSLEIVQAFTQRIQAETLSTC